MIFLIDRDKKTTDFLEKELNSPVMVWENADSMFSDVLKYNPSLIILDGHTHGIIKDKGDVFDADGFSIVRHMKKHFPMQKIIIITAHWTEDINTKAIDDGAVFCIWKNGDISKVSRKINGYLEDCGIGKLAS